MATEGDTALVHAALGKACLQKFRISHQSEWLTKAETCCRLALQLDPHAPEVLVTLARLKLRTGHPADAIEAARRSLELRSHNPEALVVLSQAHQARGNFPEAESAAEQAISQRPDHSSGHERLGHVLFRQGRYERTVRHWSRVVQLAPDNPLGHYNLASALFQLGRLEDALTSYRQAVQILPSPTAYSGMGTVYFFTGRHTEAIAMFERAIGLAPDDPRVWRNLADVQRWIPGMKGTSAESFDRAIDLLRQRISTDSEDPEHWADLALCLSKRGRTSESLDAMRRALAIAPTNINCLACAITVYEVAGDRDRSLEYLEIVLRAGYGKVELERDPELEDLRREPKARSLLMQVEMQDVESKTKSMGEATDARE